MGAMGSSSTWPLQRLSARLVSPPTSCPVLALPCPPGTLGCGKGKLGSLEGNRARFWRGGV